VGRQIRKPPDKKPGPVAPGQVPQSEKAAPPPHSVEPLVPDVEETLIDVSNRIVERHNRAVLENQYSERSDGMYQGKQTFEHSHWLRDKDLAYFAKKLPHIIFVPRARWGEYDTCHACYSAERKCTCFTERIFQCSSHQHPRLNLDREYAEFQVFGHLQRLVARGRLDTTLADVNECIVDIGGSPTRHNRYNRKYVHSCCPVLDARDIMRNLRHGTGASSWCTHTAQACDCVTPYAYISIDSLYYLSPEQIMEFCKRATSHRLIAVVHEFQDAYGTYGDGEARYHLETPSTVVMYVNGNVTPYRHSSMAWLAKGHLTINGQTLVWEKIDETADHSIFDFTVSSRVFPDSHVAARPLGHSLLDSTYYGRLLVGPLHSAEPAVTVAGELLSVPDVTLHSVGSSVFLYRHGQSAFYLAPKSLCSDVRTYVSGKERVPGTFQLANQHAKHLAQRLNIPSALIANCAFLATALAYVQDVSTEIAVLHATVEPVEHLLPVHSNALQFRFQTVWSRVKIAAAVAMSLASSATSALIAHAVGFSGGMALTAVGAVSAPVAALAVFGILKWRLRRIRARRLLAGYPIPDPPNGTQVAPLERTLFPGTPPTTSVADLLDMPIDETAEISVPDPHLRTDSSCVVAGGIVSTLAAPICAESSAHSMMSALIERQLKPQPYHKKRRDDDDEITAPSDDSFDEVLWYEYENWVLDNIDVLLPGWKQQRSASFDKWNARFPTWQRELHELYYKRVAADWYHQYTLCYRKNFTKVESQLKSRFDDGDEFKPRNISSATTERNVILAPHVYQMHSFLANDCWNWRKMRGMTIATGITDAVEYATHLRSVFDSMGEPNVMHTDAKMFDTTFHELALKFESVLVALTGAPPLVTKVMNKGIRKRGRAKFGIQYTVLGTRDSGDPQTSDGNTLHRNLTEAFAICRSAGLTAAQFVAGCYQAGLGDDGLTYVSRLWDVSGVPSILRRLGLVPKYNLATGPFRFYDADFLSCHCYPVELEDGTAVHVLAPNICRAWSKYGWFTRPPAGVPLSNLVRGDAIGRCRVYVGLPFLRILNARTLELTATCEAHTVRYILSHDTHKRIRPSDATYMIFMHLYGLTRADEEDFARAVATVPSLPFAVNFPPMLPGCRRDGTAEYGVEDVNGNWIASDEVVVHRPDGTNHTVIHPLKAQQAWLRRNRVPANVTVPRSVDPTDEVDEKKQHDEIGPLANVLAPAVVADDPVVGSYQHWLTLPVQPIDRAAVLHPQAVVRPTIPIDTANLVVLSGDALHSRLSHVGLSLSAASNAGIRPAVSKDIWHVRGLYGNE